MDFSLTIYWPAFAGALVLLGFPPSLWMGERVKRHLAHQRTAGDFKLHRGVLAWQNWADLARAYAGCALLYDLALKVPEGVEGKEWELFGWRVGILMAALLIQTIRRHHGRAYFLAPIFFVWGMTLYLSGPLLAFYGIAAGTLVASVGGNLEWKLPVMAVVVVGAGYLLNSGITLPVIANGILIVLPLLIAFLGRGHLVLLMREPR